MDSQEREPESGQTCEELPPVSCLLDAPIDLSEDKWEMPGPFNLESEEDTRVIAYREIEFKKQGWAEYLAKHLAESDVDIHKMADLLDAGCPPSTALDIFFGIS
jgi:hypothetical protein